MADRKAFINEIVTWVGKIIPGSGYTKILKTQLEAMSDETLEAYVTHLEATGDAVPIVVPNLSDVKIDIDRNLALGKELGHDFFTRLVLTDPLTGLTYLTPVKYLVIPLPLRRQQQLLEEKTSIPDHNRQVDDLTGQPTGDSKGASLSYPEIQVLRSQGCDESLRELIKYRGGDVKGFQAMNRAVAEQGGVSLDDLAKTPTDVKSTTTLHTYLISAHLDNNI